MRATDITIVPSIGVEIPVVTNGDIDVPVRCCDIESHRNFGIRADYKMTIG